MLAAFPLDLTLSTRKLGRNGFCCLRGEKVASFCLWEELWKLNEVDASPLLQVPT